MLCSFLRLTTPPLSPSFYHHTVSSFSFSLASSLSPLPRTQDFVLTPQAFPSPPTLSLLGDLSHKTLNSFNMQWLPHVPCTDLSPALPHWPFYNVLDNLLQQSKSTRSKPIPLPVFPSSPDSSSTPQETHAWTHVPLPAVVHTHTSST